MAHRMQVLSRLVLATALSIYAFEGRALAQTTGEVFEVPGVNNYVAVAVGTVPDYLGSDDYTIGAAPAALVKLGDTERYVRLLVTDVNVNLIDDRNWRLGPALNYRLGRNHVKDDAVDAMEKIDGTFEVGAFGGWTWIGTDDPRHRFTIGTEFLYDVGGEHDGYLVSGSARYYRPVLRPLTLSIGASLTYGSGDYMETYFGVNAKNFGSSGLDSYDADAGLRDVRIPLMAVFSFNENWHIAGGIVYSRLLNEAADSPVVDDRGSKNQLFAGIGIGYAW